jgi:hypothetical protein
MRVWWLFFASVACGQVFGQLNPASVAVLQSPSVVNAETQLPSDRPITNPTGGYVAGNFGISAQFDEAVGPRAWIKVNPPKLGVWLQNFATGELWIQKKGQSARRLHLSAVKVSRLYPEYEAAFDAEGKVRIRLDAFAPLSFNSKIGFLPGLILRVKLESDRPWSGIIGYTLTQAKPERDSDDDPTPWPAETRRIEREQLAGMIRGRTFLAIQGLTATVVRADSEADTVSVSAPIEIGSGVEKQIAFIAGSFDANGYYVQELPTAEKLIQSLASRIESLHDHLHDFVAALPRTGDTKIDEYLRWYVSAGILLTKGDRDGDVLTMGYRELNPRDSFWTSGIHLVFWKDLERKMIQEIGHSQFPSGRIPATLLPLIDRGDEIDTTEYFILRASRFYQWYRDDEFLHQAWPSIQRAIDYLASRDTEHVGVPMQLSYWGDWKDVPAVQGRKYAPHFALLWLASLRAASELATAANDPQAAARYKDLGDRADAFINRSVDEGGLWNGTHYVDRWSDGRRPNYVLEDQVVGAYFNVIPEHKLHLIYRDLEANATRWGVRETFPYISGWTEQSGGEGGNYHNGGIWPWLNFVDVTGRYNHGQAEDAERILREVGLADLDANGGDDKPGEYLNGDSGANRGFPIQGWDADMFSAIYFGAFGVNRTSRSKIRIKVHIPPQRDFSTQLVLPACTGILSRRLGKVTWEEKNKQCQNHGVRVLLGNNP